MNLVELETRISSFLKQSLPSVRNNPIYKWSLLRNLQIYYCVHKSATLFHILRQINSLSSKRVLGIRDYLNGIHVLSSLD
jgi:hypothetical protein